MKRQTHINWGTKKKEFESYTREYLSNELILNNRFASYWKYKDIIYEDGTIHRLYSPVYEYKDCIYIGRQYFWDGDGRYSSYFMPEKDTVLYEDILRQSPPRGTL